MDGQCRARGPASALSAARLKPAPCLHSAHDQALGMTLKTGSRPQIRPGGAVQIPPAAALCAVDGHATACHLEGQVLRAFRVALAGQACSPLALLRAHWLQQRQRQGQNWR